MRLFGNHIIKWVCLLTMVSFTKQECLFSNGKYMCEKMSTDDDIVYEFYNRVDFNQHVTSIEILETRYRNIDPFLYPLQEKIEDILEIKVSRCGVEIVSDNAFKHFANLQVLDLSNNKIQNISFVKQLPTVLKKLYLNGNDIVKVDNVFSNLKHLKYVDLSFCKIENFDFNVFKDVMRLDLVNVSNNKIKSSLSKTLPTNIRHGDISHNILANYSNIPVSHDVSFTLFGSLQLNNFDYKNDTIFIEKLMQRGLNTVSIQAIDSDKSNASIEIDYLDISYANYSVKTLKNLVKVKILKELNLRHSIIPVLNKSIYNLANLFHKESSGAKLDLSNCSVADIQERYFENYILGTLNLSGNSIKKIKGNTFHNARFEVLDLSCSKIETIETLAFDGLNCGSLNLSRNELNALSLTNIKSMKELDLSYNKIRTITSGSLGGLKNVELLDLSNNLLTSLDTYSLSSFENIKVLNLADNKLINIKGLFLFGLKINSLLMSYTDGIHQDTFKNANNYFKSITLSDVETKELDKDYFIGLHNLEVMSLKNSNVHSLADGSLNGLFSLQVLDSQSLFKRIKTLKKHVFKDLKALIKLDLSSLSIENIEDKTFAGLKSLHELNLTSNNITNISSETFSGLTTLHGLYLGRNELATIPLGAFMYLPLLESLNLSYNLLSQLEIGVFSNLRHLTHLDISYNVLSTIHPEVLFPLKNLVQLHLDGNNLITLDYKNLLSDAPVLSVIGLSDNKWNCQFLYQMLKGIEMMKITYQPLRNVTFTARNINGVLCTDECDSEIYCAITVAPQ